MADLYYIEEDYWDPSLGYYVYTADAAAAISAAGSVSCDATKITAPLEAAASITSTFTQTTEIVRIQTAQSDISAAFTQSSAAGKILNAVIDCGALFSPGVIADAFKNHTAILDVVFTTTTVGVANRSATMAIDNMANLNAQAAKTVDVDSAFSSTATQLAQVSKLVDTSSTLQTESTLSVNAITVELASAAFTTSTNAQIIGKAGTERSLSIQSSSNVSIDTSIKKFGAGSLNVPDNAFIKYYATSNMVPDFGFSTKRQLVVELQYRPSSKTGDTLLQYTDGTTVFWRLYDTGTFEYIGSNNVLQTKVLGVEPTVDSFNHLLITFDGQAGTCRIFLNGTRRHNSTAQDFKQPTSSKGFLQIGQSTLGANGRVDELRVLTGVPGMIAGLGYDTSQTTITQPSQAFVNNADTRFLAHYDVDFRDDAATLVSASPVLTSQFTLTALAQELSSGQAGLSSTAGLTASMAVNRSADSALTSAAALDVTATRIQETASSSQAEFNQTAQAVKTAAIEATLNNFVTVVSQGDRTRTATVTIDSAFTPTLVADVFKNMTAILDAVSTLTAQATTSVDIASALSSASTVTADATRIRTADTTATSSAQLAATVFRTQDNQAAIAATATLSVVVGEEQDADAAISSASTLAANVVKTAAGVLAVTSQFAQAASVQRLRSTQVSLVTESAFAATAVKINPGHAALAATASLSAQAVKTTETTATADSAFTQSTAVNRQVAPAVEFTSIATQLTVAFQNASGTVLLESTASLAAIIGSIKQAVPERAITGIRFNDDAATELGDTFIKLSNYQSPPAGPTLSDRFAVAFWAYSPQGTVLTHNPTTYNAASGYMAFDNGSFELRSPSPNNDYRTATWTGLATEGWHHYLIYQTPAVGAENPLVKLYQDGVLKADPAIYSFDDGTSPSPPTDDLLAVWYDPRQLFSNMHWCIGAQVQHWDDDFNEVNFGAYQVQPMQGVLSQFVSYWTTVPDFTNTAIRQQLYNNGYVDLGNMGTQSGLAQPKIYLRLQNYRDVEQLGSVNFTVPNSLVWREITNTSYTPISGGAVRYILTGAHEGTVQDNFGNGFLAITDLECSVSGVFLFELPISAEFTTAIAGQRVRTANAALVCTSTITAQAQTQASLAATLLAQSTVSADAARTRTTATAITATASMTIEQGFLQVAFADLACMSQLACDATEIEAIQAAAALTSTATVTADVNNVLFMQATASAEFAVTAEATLIPPVRATASLTAEFSLVINAGGVYGGISLEASAGTLTADISVIRGASAQLTATVSTNIIPNKRTGIPLTNLSVNGFTVIAGDIINFEPSLIYVIPEETRGLLILAESREYMIAQETRQLTLLEG